MLTVVDAPRDYCPGCSPETNPVTEFVQVHYCMEHFPATTGSEDALVRSGGYLFGGGGTEADGADCRAAAEVFHRDR